MKKLEEMFKNQSDLFATLLDQLKAERKDQLFNYWLHLEKALALIDPKAPACHKAHPKDHTKWCDSGGPGGFMGHVCKQFDGGSWPLKVPFHFGFTTPKLLNPCPRCGIGHDTDGDGNCAVCGPLSDQDLGKYLLRKSIELLNRVEKLK